MNAELCHVHFVYLARCADGTLYTGYARDPDLREKQHNLGRGARYTAGRRPVRVVYTEAFGSVGEALKRECAIKRLPRVRKEALIAGAPLEIAVSTEADPPRQT